MMRRVTTYGYRSLRSRRSKLCWIAAGAVLLAAPPQNAPLMARVPSDPLELVTGTVRVVQSSGQRAALVQLLDRARQSFALPSAGRAYDLKVSFTVDSGGQTEHDGAWKMEDIFDPKQGHRWTAESSDAYTILRISFHGMLYGEDTENHVPLRLQEARAALFDAIPSAENVSHASIRKSTAMFKGMRLTCVLLSGNQSGAKSAPGRRWDESEECIDPQSGLVAMHSQVPGRYFLYDYSDPPRLGDRVLPRKVTVREGGRPVTRISVETLTELPAADPSLFVPTEEMKAKGRAIVLARAQKIWQHVSGGSGGAPHAVCVFGVVTPKGELVEAHSLQPSDPDSRAAVQAAQQMSFSYPPLLAVRPQQHFVFLIQEFGSSR